MLRIYEGCARALVGDIDEANLIKLHRFSGKVSYISYPDFEKKPHPALRLRVKVSKPSVSVPTEPSSIRPGVPGCAADLVLFQPSQPFGPANSSLEWLWLRPISL
jgi:hypothetical protein